jgi:acetyl esterase
VITGRSYLERGEPVTVLIQWRHSTGVPSPHVLWVKPPARTGPRNVLIERADGSRVIRGFRGLRKMPEEQS